MGVPQRVDLNDLSGLWTDQPKSHTFRVLFYLEDDVQRWSACFQAWYPYGVSYFGV